MSEDYVTGSGTGELHLGWAVPGERVCLGAGPVNLRFSAAEAAQLHARLGVLLREVVPGDEAAFTRCGCCARYEPGSGLPLGHLQFSEDWDQVDG
jgi:hypothetical protein